MKMDAEIVELRYLYVREQTREIELGKRNILMSNVIKAKMDRCIRARNVLAKSVKDKPAQRVSWQLEEVARRNRIEDAEVELKELGKQYEDALLQALLNPSDDANFKVRDLAHEIGIQKRRVVNYTRAHTNWLKKEQLVKVRETRNKLIPEYSVQQDIEEVLEQPIDENILKGIALYENSKETQEDIKYTEIPINNATFDLLRAPKQEQEVPRKRVVIDFED